VKSLRLYWKPVEDEFRFDGVMSVNKSKMIKRSLLANLNRVFVPLGFLVPVLIKGKIFIQQIWQLKIDWAAYYQKIYKSHGIVSIMNSRTYVL